MGRYYQIGRANLKLNLAPHLLLSALLLGLSPLFMGVENLNAQGTAGVLEMFVALLGIVLVTPVFLPEQNKDIRELVESKYTSSTIVIIIRVLEAAISLAALVGIYILILKNNNCTFPGMKFYLGTMAEALFLGGIGLCAYSIFDQIAIAYMLPLMYYILDISGGKKLLKGFHMFTMAYGSYQEKINLAAAGGILLLIGICYPYVSRRLVPGVKRIIRKQVVSRI